MSEHLKLSEKQFLLVLNGPSCGGKSSVAKIILEKYSGIYNAKSDQIKWLISGYKSVTYREVVDDMTMATIDQALLYGLPVIKEGGLWVLDKLKELAKKHSVSFFIANISAPKEVLDERFQERIQAKKNGARIANVDPARFDEIHELFLKTKTDTPLSFDSSASSPEDIAREIVAYIQTNLK